jgi:hypothetical protein
MVKLGPAPRPHGNTATDSDTDTQNLNLIINDNSLQQYAFHFQVRKLLIETPRETICYFSNKQIQHEIRNKSITPSTLSLDS